MIQYNTFSEFVIHRERIKRGGGGGGGGRGGNETKILTVKVILETRVLEPYYFVF